MAQKNRRGHGEGAISQRRDGRWEARIELGWRDGKRRRKSLFAATRAEVLNKLKAAVHDHDGGLPMTADRATVGEFFTRWLEETVRLTVRPGTYTGYELIYRNHIAPDLSKVRLTKLGIQEVQALLDRKLASGLSPQTVHHIRTVLRRALNHAMRWELVKRNIATLVDAPRVAHREIRPLSADEARRLLDFAKEDRLAALYTIALSLGLRLGEILGLRWIDIDADGRKLHVNQSVRRIGKRAIGGDAAHGRLDIAEVKTDRSRRTLVLPEVAMRALKAHHARQAETRLAAGLRWHDSGLVFTTTIGTAVEPRNVIRDFHLMLTRLNEGPLIDAARTAAGLKPGELRAESAPAARRALAVWLLARAGVARTQISTATGIEIAVLDQMHANVESRRTASTEFFNETALALADLKVRGRLNLRFHDLRHSAASLLLAQGVPLRSIMEILGHSSIGVTADIYSHIAPAMMQDAAEKIDAALGSGSN